MPYNDELFQKFAAEGAKEQPEGLFPTGTPAVQQPQQEDAYSRMVREQYGQQQQAQQGKKNESSLLDNGLTRGFAGGLIGVPASLADFGSGMLGTDGQVGTYLHNKANEYGGREKEYSWEEMKENPIDYLTDTRSGALYGFGNALGSSAGLMAATALAAKALPGAAAVGAGAKALQIANKIPGLNLAATPAGKLMALRVLQTVPEAMSQGGSKWREETHDQYGNLKEDADFGDARTKMLWDAALNVPLLALSNTLEAGITNKLVKDAAGKGLGFKLWQGAKGGAINMAQQGGEEGYQTGIDEYVGGERTLGQILNPLTWTDEAKAAAAEGAIGGVGQSAMMTGGGMALNAAFGGDDTTGGNTPPPPIPSPAEQGATLNNAVTLNEFPEAAGIAMNDHSGNPVDRMRNLQGTITHDASDGTNCMRTIGLALAGTPYGDLINVDDAINVAGNLGQLQDPANYVPRPGDLAVVNDGGHIVMVTENGGTIQNGQSANGVYESDLSPDQMFGGVKYYISASEFFGDNFTPVQRVMPAGGTAESQIAEQSFLEQGNEKPLFETGQQEQQQEPPRTYEPEYLETLRNSNMSDAELVETARGMQNLSNEDPAKQIIIDKLRRRQINAGTGFTMEGNYPAIRNQRSEVTTPGTPRMEVRQEKTQNPPATPTGANDEVAQQFVNHYMGNPQSFMAHAQAQAQRIKQAYQTGAITQEQAVNNLQMLNDLVGRVMPAIQDDGTIRQGQREKGFTFGSSEGRQGTTQQTAQQPRQQYQAANIKPKDMPRLLNVARSAMAGDPEAVKRFMNYKPEVQQTLSDIITGVLPVNEALRNRQEVPELPAGRSIESGQTQLQKPETRENRNQNQHSESGQVEQKKDSDRQTPEEQSKDVNRPEQNTSANKHLNSFKSEIKAAVRSMSFTQAKADELLKKYNSSLNDLLERKAVTDEEAKANRYSMEDEVKRGFILNDGRKMLDSKVRDWLDNHPFKYDKSKSREENIAAAQKLKDDFIRETGISRTNDGEVTPERIELRKRIVDYLYNVGAEKRRREKKATLAIGFPAAGKSTVSKDLTDNKGYLLIDADEAKKLLPEFHNGVLADIVHDESSDLSKVLFRYAVTQGDNICWPTIGGKYDSLKKKISELHNDAGKLDENTGKELPSYEVTLSYVDIPANEALKRIFNRFEETGRFDNPQNIHNLVLQNPEGHVTIKLPEGKRKERLGSTETVAVDNMILKNYLAIKDEKGVERYEWIDNGLPVDASVGEKLREAGRLQSGSVGRHVPGTGESGSGTGRGDSGGDKGEVQATENTELKTDDDSTQDEGAISLPENEIEKPQVANPVSADEIPDSMLEESAAKEKIEDFGQKIGGARKDTATKRGSAGGKSGGDTDKAKDFMKHVWFRNYEIVKDDKGKWDARDKNHRWWKLNTNGYDTEEESKTALFKYVMGKKHHITETSRGSGEFAIERWIGSGSDAHWFCLKKGFKSREAAKEYYDEHLEEIFKINTTFGESDLPTPLIKSWQEARTGTAPQRLKNGEDATAKMFSDTFGFRGVQFGKWENQKERKSVLNATYEGLLDLADALGLSPKELSLGGELGIAFGARGKGGKNAALAHYELAYNVINLTKMKGAGSLAHEWMHAVDHYLSMKAGTFSSNRDSDGKLTDKAGWEISNMASHRLGALYHYFNKDRANRITFKNLADAFCDLVNSLKIKKTSYTENAETVKNTIEETTRDIAGYINYLRSNIKRDAKNVSQEDLQRLDKIYERLLAADESLYYDYDFNYEMTPALKALNDIHKRITGKYLLKGRSVEYPFWGIRNAIKKIQNQRKLYKDAISQTQKTGTEKTDFLKNSMAIDKGRTTPYWANDEEMLARAFTTMVEDTLAEKGYASNFLAFGDNSDTGYGKPYPEGEERKAINQAFKKFFEAYKNDIEGIVPEPKQETVTAQEGAAPVVSEETVNTRMEDLESKMQDVINKIMVEFGIGNPNTSRREAATETTSAEVEETEQVPETNSEETVISENDTGNEPENVVESDQEAESEEGEENHVDNEEGLSGIPEGETSEGLSGNEEGRDAGSVRGTEDRGSEGVLREPEVPVSGQSSESEHGLRGQSEKSDGSGSIREGNDKRNGVRTGVNEDEEKPLTPAQEKDAKASETPGHNFTITEEKEAAIGEGGKKTKYKNNVAAIRLLKQLEAENRQATPAEQETLAKYVGWGRILEAFSRYDKDWQNEFKELEGLLTEEEYAAARASTKNAHFTSIGIVKDMWKIVERLGFKGGRVLEPSMGVGNFFGAMPENLRSRSSLNGVELDSITGRIAKQLYQKANIVISGFENKDNVKFPNNYFDLAISNVPFGDYKIHDKDYKNQYNIHNYFFAKSLDKVRPGGLICFITSTGTMDSGSDSKQIRRLLADKADLVGAIRLPNTSFKGNAGTQVTTDLIILQKRKEGAAPAAFNSDWLDTGDSELTSTKYQDFGKPLKINKYYLDHPNMLIGKLAEDTLYGGGRLALDGKGVDVLKELDKRIDSLPEKIYEPVKHTRNTDSRQTANTFLASAGTRDNSYQLNEDGKVYQNNAGTMVELPKAAQPKAKAYVELRNVSSEILQKQINPDTSEEELKKLRKELNKKYDSFVKKFGYVNSDKNRRALSLDPEYGIISALEDYTVDKTTKKESAKKSAIFTKRTVNPINTATSADNPTDALALSLSEKGEVDIDYIGKLLGETPENAAAKLGDMVYDDPVSQNYVTAEEYLSGNVREKLEAAQFAAKNDPRYKRNVEALKKVQPVDLSAEEISVNLGTPWIPDTDISKFANEMLDENYNPVMKVTFSPLIGQWTVDWIKGNWRLNSVKSGMENTVKWGIPQHPFHKVLEDALNQKSPVITTTLGDGKTKVVDQKATAAAQEKVRQVQAEFKKWIWKDKERKERLVNYYNRNFNNTRLREYDGSHLTLPGYSAVAPQLNKHQKDAIWRIMQRGNTLLAHCVGAGKTWTMQTAAMEMKRLGIANKSMFVIPNHMVAQFEKEFRQIYSSAKLLTIDSENLPDVTIPKKKNATPEEEKAAKAAKIAQRQKILSSIATEDWDGIIISHNTFKRIPLSAKTTQEFYQKQINELVDAIEASKENGGKGNRAVKDLEKAKARLEAKLKDLANEEEKDVVIPFEQLGVDQIFVDEADLFKNLYFVTKMSRVAGLSNTASQRSMDMYMKTQYLTRVNNGRGVCFATGTPISNTMAEMFTMMRYLDSDGLMEKGISTFDNWAANFAVHEPTVERSPDGNGYRQVEKFTSFTNMPELIRMFRKFADVKRPEDLNLEVPKLKNGKTTTIEIKPSKALTNYIKGEIKKRSEAIHNKLVDPSEDNMLKLTGDLRKASLDMRLVDSTIPAAQAGGKLRAVADTIFKKYKETTKVKGAQLVFCDLSAPKGASDKVTETDAETGNADEFATEENTNVTAYEEIKKMLVAKGMPAKEIAFIHDAKNKKQKEALFEKVRNGDIRVLLGSTEKMGAGTNCQDHLVALHHIDAPWRPRDIEQRNGRILRRGNQNKEVEIFNYVTKDSFDANMWEKLKNKANMIGQAMSNNLTTRTIEDMDANVLSFAEVEALASGNPLMAEKTMVDADVTKYNMLLASYLKTHAAVKENFEIRNPAKIKNAEQRLADAKADVPLQANIAGDKFKIEIGGKSYTKRVDADKALKKIVEGYSNELGGIVGKVGGLKIRLRAEKAYSAEKNQYFTQVHCYVEGAGKYECDPTLGSIEYAATHKPEQQAGAMQAVLDSLKKEQKALAEEVKKPFEHQDKLDQLLKRQEEINKELHIGEENAPQEGQEKQDNEPEFSIREIMDTDPEMQRAVEELQREIKDAFPGAKDVHPDGDDIVFTMPNDVQIRANIKEQYLFRDPEEAARAKREHGISDNANVVAEGYYQKINDRSLVVLTQESSKGTAYHEAFHAVWDWVLNDKEKSDMTRYYSDKAKKTGANAEELMADGYKEWKLARAKGSGTLFGKLYKKINDFIDTAKAIFTGMYKVHKIYEKIESGDVWNRDAQGRFTGGYNENYKKFQAAMSKRNAPKTIEEFDKAIREADKPSKIGFWFTTSKGAEITIPGSNYKHIQDGDHPLTIKQWKAVIENLENADYAEKDNVVGPNGGVPVQIKIDTPLGKAGVSLEVLPNGRILVDTAVFNNDAAIDNWIKNKKSSQTLGIEPNGKQDRILGRLSLFDIIRDKLGIVNKFENTANEKPKFSIRTGEGNDKTATGKVAQAMRNTERLTTVESGKEWIKEKWKNFYVDWIDKNHRMHDFDAAVSQGIGRELTADERVYDRVQTLSASASGMATGLIEGDARNIKAINEHLKHRQLKHNVTLNMIMKKIGKEVMDKAYPDYLKKHGLSNWVNAFGNYLGARRLLEMEKVSQEAYKEQLAQWNKDKADGKKVGKQPVWKGYKFPQGLDHDTLAAMIREAPHQFAEAADMYYKFNDNVLTILEDAGLISEATHDLLATKYKNYCPLMRDFTDTAAADNFIGGLTNGGRGIANVSNMLKHISMEGSGRAIINPLESTVKAVSVACNRAERNKVGQMAVNMAMKNNLTRLIKSVPGGAPDAKNCIFTVMYNGKKFAFQTTQELYSPIVGYNLPAAGFVMGSLRAAARALRTGATTSPSFIVRNLIRDTIFAAISSKHGFKPFVDTIRGINAILNNPELKAEFETAGVTAFNFYGSAEEITKSLDELNGGKLQIHKPADILKALMRGFSFASELVESGTRMGEFMRAREQGESIEAAARAARELTLDFSRSGVTGERVNQMVPFFNACLQGGDKMVRLFREDPAGTFVKVAKYIILPSMFLWAINHDEPWYKELDPNIKNTCWILPGDIRIPKPQEAGVFFGSGVEALLDKMYNTDPDAGKNWASAFKDAMMPNIIPTLFLPLQEWQANYSYYRGKALVGKGLERLPDEMQYYQGTSEASKAIGSAFKVSPVKVDNLVRGYTGTMGMFVWQNLMDWTSDEKNNRPAKKLSEMPFIRDFNVTEANLHRTTDEFYDMAQNAQKWQNAYGKKGSPPAAISAINKANTFISKKQKEIRQISASRNLSPERKRELITVRRLQIKRVAEQALNRYRDKF